MHSREALLKPCGLTLTDVHFLLNSLRAVLSSSQNFSACCSSIESVAFSFEACLSFFHPQRDLNSTAPFYSHIKGRTLKFLL